MSTEEFEREFDILYNNIMSNAAPSIDAYEKSVFLTKAQEDLVLAIYDGSFENSEKLIESLSNLVVTELLDSSTATQSDKSLSSQSKIFSLKEDTLFIVYETLVLDTTDKCGNKLIINVKPTKHDEYYRVASNPFKRPRKREALRVNSELGVEIISIYDTYKYKVRYVRKPKPIILYNEESLTIDGKDTQSPCELNESMHRMILDRAVLLASETYKNNK